MQDTQTLVLSAEDVRQAVRHVGLDEFMDRLTAMLHSALDEFEATSYEIPHRDGFHYEHPNTGLVEWMPLLREGRGAVIKMVGYHPHNPHTHGLPTVLSSLLAFDTTTGHLDVLADGTLATALRTGAASAVASRVLAKPSSSRLGLIGAGAQAVTQLHALSRVFPLTDVYVHDCDERAASEFLTRIEPLGLGVAVHLADARSVVEAADILCTVTSVAPGAGPVIEDVNVNDDVHVNAVGSDFPGKFELPLSLLERSFVCADFKPQATREGESQRLAEHTLGPDFAELVQGRSQFEAQQSRPTVFDSTGYALEDAVVLELLLQVAREIGLGRSIDIEGLSNPHDPYEGLFADRPWAKPVRSGWH
jgi:ornithine cyclodeaminase/alanine dehydrogenase-like protein (mu-crystallin family)